MNSVVPHDPVPQDVIDKFYAYTADRKIQLISINEFAKQVGLPINQVLPSIPIYLSTTSERLRINHNLRVWLENPDPSMWEFNRSFKLYNKKLIFNVIKLKLIEATHKPYTVFYIKNGQKRIWMYAGLDRNIGYEIATRKFHELREQYKTADNRPRLRRIKISPQDALNLIRGVVSPDVAKQAVDIYQSHLKLEKKRNEKLQQKYLK